MRSAAHRLLTEPLGPVEARRIADLLDGARLYGPMIVGVLLLGAFVAAPWAPAWAVGTFVALLLVECTVKMLLTVSYPRAMRSGRPSAIWRLVVFVGSSYSGIVYGGASLVLFLPMPEPARLLLAAAYAAVLALGIWGMPQYFPAGACLAIPMAAPVCLALLSVEDDARFRLLGALILLVTLVGLWVSRRTGAGLVRLIELDLENRRLLERLEREKAVTDAERERAERAVIDKSRFVATASHDLRQPVHALGLFQHALALRCERPEDAVLIDAIGESSDALMALLDGLLDVSSLDARAVTPEPEPLELDALLGALEREFAPSIAARGLALRLDTERCTVLSDAQLLSRVLRNLVSNAAKFSRRGTITLHARDAVGDDGADVVRVQVRDEGPGIAPDDAERVFAEFYRCRSEGAARTDGSGLGLSIVARLCALLGIALALESEPGRGTTVRLDVPRAPAGMPATTDAPAKVEREPRLDGLRVLVVDDDPAIRAGMRETLEGRGCTVDVADGLAGARARIAHAPPDVLLCDYRIGPGPDGIAVIEALRREAARPLPAAIITGESLDRIPGHEDDPDIELLRKPVPPPRLYDALRRLSRDADRAG